MAGVAETFEEQTARLHQELQAEMDTAGVEIAQGLATAVPEPPRPRHGFSRWNNPEKHTAAAVKGGRAAHEKGVAHEWTSASARAAALKSVAVRRAKKAARLAVVPTDV